MDKKIIIVGHVDIGNTILHESIIRELDNQEALIVVNDESKPYLLTNQPTTYTVSNHRPYPMPSICGEEKKRTKPCVKHEYTQQFNDWICRHCGRKL